MLACYCYNSGSAAEGISLRVSDRCQEELKHPDSDAYQAASRTGRCNLHLASNETYAISTNSKSEDHEYSYVDKNCVTEIGTQREENKVITSHSITDQAAADHANLTPDKEDRENTYENDSCLSSADLENEVTT